MTSNDNSVNIKSYHHGDLRSALIAAGLDALKNRAADDLSLREVARAVGVSATAVYRHFPDKQALLYALCAEGAEALGRAQAAAMKGAGGGSAGFLATGNAYVCFALDHPALFRLMMSAQPPEGLIDGELSAVNSAMQLLRDNVSGMVPENATDQDRRQVALHAWSVVHGLSMLMLDGQVPADRTVIDGILSLSFPPLKSFTEA